LQGLAPEHVAYVGTASALLAPTLRLGWAVLPARLVIPAADQIFASAIATSRITQLTLAEFIERGDLDRHLRKSLSAYRPRREALLAGLARHLPDAPVIGSPAGLFLSVKLPATADEAKVLAGARSRGLGIDGFNEHAALPQAPGVVLGFASAPEPTLRLAVRDLAAAIALS
jgi:GntR family transcriptional regulator/MocR family aminotransferase